jgi:hypothetical protein
MVGHGAANVTLGIPRLREIVMTASQKPKTPSMSMRVRPAVSQEDIDLFCKRASRVKLSQVVDSVVVREELKVEGEARRTQLTVDIKFFSQEEYQTEYDVNPLEILTAFATKFPLTLKKEMLKEMKKLDADLRSQIADLGKGRKARENADEDVGEDEEGESAKKKKAAEEESEVGDGDAEDEKRARQRKEQTTYDSDDNDMDDPEEDGHDLEAEFASPSANNEDQQAEKKMQGSFKSEVKKVASVFTQNLHQATSFEFTESGCTFQLEVSGDLLSGLYLTFCILSSYRTFQNCSLWASSSVHVAQRSYARFLESQSVSKLRMTRKRMESLR